MTEAAHRFEHNGIPIEIHYMDDAGNPYKEWDQASRLLISPALAREYSLDAETCHEMADHDGPVVERWLRLTQGYPVVVPFYFADYGSGGARAYLTDAENCSGFVVVDAETVAREWNGDTAAAERCARAEFETFAAWVEGNVYGYVVAPDTPEEDSCWGFYGEYTTDDDTSYGGATQAAKESAEYAARERARREWWNRVYLLDPNPGPMPATV